MSIPTQSKKFAGENYSFVGNWDTKYQANTNAKLQRKGGYNARIYRWKRADGKILYTVYIRRSKRFKW